MFRWWTRLTMLCASSIRFLWIRPFSWIAWQKHTSTPHSRTSLWTSTSERIRWWAEDADSKNAICCCLRSNLPSRVLPAARLSDNEIRAASFFSVYVLRHSLLFWVKLDFIHQHSLLQKQHNQSSASLTFQYLSCRTIHLWPQNKR